MKTTKTAAGQSPTRLLLQYDVNIVRHVEEYGLDIIAMDQCHLHIGLCFITALVLFVSGCPKEAPAEILDNQIIKAVIGEAEGEPFLGKIAVACAIQNRGNLHGIYGLTAKRVKNHKYSLKTYLQAKKAVILSHDIQYCQELIHGASFWEGTKFPTPYWAANMKVTAIIGNQKFFKDIHHKKIQKD